MKKNIWHSGIEPGSPAQSSKTLTNELFERSLQEIEAQNLENAWIDFFKKFILCIYRKMTEKYLK